MNRNFDIDLDVGDRQKVLAVLQHTPASILKDGKLIKHNTGIYVNPVPIDPISGLCSLDYKTAEEYGYIKLDFLNVNVYQQVRDNEHLSKLLLTPPDWNRLNDRKFVEQLIHIGSYYDLLQRMPEPVNSIPRMAMFLALIRPGKKHLIGKPWVEIAKTIWDKTDDGYSFKKSHSIGYSHLVVVHMNLLTEQESS